MKRMFSLVVALALLSAALLPTLAQDDPQATISALETQLAELSSPTPASIPASPTTVSEGESVTVPQVNIEFILDASGSMANLTDTGETRMDAAKRVLHDVVASIPDQSESINVGFRIYGHIGTTLKPPKRKAAALPT